MQYSSQYLPGRPLDFYLWYLKASSCEQFVYDQDHSDHDQNMDNTSKIGEGEIAY